MKQKKIFAGKKQRSFFVYYFWQLNKIKQVAKRIANIRLTEAAYQNRLRICLLYTSPSPRDCS